MIWNGQFHTKQLNDGADQSFSLAQRQPEQGAQGQGRYNRQIRVCALPARCGSRLRPPALDRLLGEPDCQAAARPKPRVIPHPVANPMALPGNVMAARHIGFERQERAYTGRRVGLLPRYFECRNRAPRCNKVPLPACPVPVTMPVRLFSRHDRRSRCFVRQPARQHGGCS
jgi:hypothetical protein